jgi:hypothetical protein
MSGGAYLTRGPHGGLVRGCRACKMPLAADMSCPRCSAKDLAALAERVRLGIRGDVGPIDAGACRACGYHKHSATCPTLKREVLWSVKHDALYCGRDGGLLAEMPDNAGSRCVECGLVYYYSAILKARMERDEARWPRPGPVTISSTGERCLWAHMRYVREPMSLTADNFTIRDFGAIPADDADAVDLARRLRG